MANRTAAVTTTTTTTTYLSPAEILIDVVPLIGALISLVASTYMLWLLMSLPRPSRQRLLLRQLLHLSFANVFYSTGQILEETLELLVMSGWKGSSLAPSKWRYVCITINTPASFGATASMLFECHLALAFTASILRYVPILNVLSCLLVALWPLAMLLTAGDIVSVSDKKGYFWQPETVGCVMEHGNIVDVWYMSFAVLFCIVCYLISSWSVYNSGIAVQRRVWGRAQTYPLMAVITLVPSIVYNVVPLDWLYYSQVINYFCYTGATLSRNLSGVIYFAFYSLNTRFVRHAHRDSVHTGTVQKDEASQEDTKEHSFRVNFREGASVLEFGGTPARTPSSVSSASFLRPASSPDLVAENGSNNLLISYYMDSWTTLNSGAGRRWGAVDEEPDRPLSPLSSTLRSDLSR